MNIKNKSDITTFILSKGSYVALDPYCFCSAIKSLNSELTTPIAMHEEFLQHSWYKVIKIDPYTSYRGFSKEDEEQDNKEAIYLGQFYTATGYIVIINLYKCPLEISRAWRRYVDHTIEIGFAYENATRIRFDLETTGIGALDSYNSIIEIHSKNLITIK